MDYDFSHTPLDNPDAAAPGDETARDIADNLWQRTAELLQAELGAKKVQDWFGPGAVIKTGLRGDNFYIGAADGFVKTTLELYLNQIEQALQQVSSTHLLPFIINLSAEEFPALNLTGNSGASFLTQETFSPRPGSAETSFNPRYTFSSFVVGESNRFAHAAAMAVAENPSHSYNPLFIYGGSGLGKTHLMHAIGQTALKKNPYKKVIYISSEAFTNEFIYMLRESRMEMFKAKYRNIDILLIDDIQFMAKKKETQEEFFHTFNALHDAGKQIVISSDRHPREINPLEERLRSRFGWGLITDIQAPDWETRCAILQNKAITSNIPIDDEVIKAIADKIDTNIRDLEGALNRLTYYAELNQAKSIDMSLAYRALTDVLSRDATPRLTIALIQKAVADRYQITVEDLKSKRKDRDVSFPRQIAMYLCRELIGSTTTQIGRDFGNRHYSTVMYACDTIASQRQDDENLEHNLKALEQELKK